MSDLALFNIKGVIKQRDYRIFEDLGLGGEIKNMLAVEVSSVGEVCVAALKSAVPRKTEQLRASIVLEGRERGFITDDESGKSELENTRRVIVKSGFRRNKKFSDGKDLANTVTENVKLALILDDGRNEASPELVSLSAASLLEPKRPRKLKEEQQFLRRKKKARAQEPFKDGDIAETEKRAPTRGWIRNGQNAAESKIARMK